VADGVFNIAKGRAAAYADNVGTGNAALILVVLEASGLVADAVMEDYDTLAAVLAGASNEQTDMGRKTVTSCTVTTDDTGDEVTIDIADQTWSAATGNATGKLLVCYDADTTAGTDSNIIPLTFHDFTVTPDGNNVIAQIDASGLYGAS
jgi:hypothetical protein